MKEELVHHIIENNEDAKKDIICLLGVEFSKDIIFRHEHRIANNMIIDFTIIRNDEIIAFIECKGSNISTTDFVRGLGQAEQYSGLKDKPHLLKGYKTSKNTKVLLLCPSSVFSKTSFDLSNYTLPQDVMLVEINDFTHSIRYIEGKEIKKLQAFQKSNLVTINHYYFRDNRIYELYYLLRFLTVLKVMNFKKVDRNYLEDKYLSQLQTHNNRNWRNAFITLSSLGYIDNKNLISRKGMELAVLNFGEFAYQLYEGYLKPYFRLIFDALNTRKTNPFVMTNETVSGLIRANHGGKDVLFLTESDNRYISSFMNILRDDFGCIRFETRSAFRTFVYDITKYHEKAIIDEINKHSCAKDYEEAYKNMIYTLDLSERS